MQVHHLKTTKRTDGSSSGITFNVTLDDGRTFDIWLEIAGRDCEYTLPGSDDPFIWGDSNTEIDLQEKVFDQIYSTPEYKACI